jgi:hypothetical protein
MMNLLILSMLVGGVLGMRLRVLILIPAIGFAFAGIGGIGAARGDAPSLVAVAMILAAISLEVGYLAGSATRLVLAATRAPDRSRIPAPARSARTGGQPKLSA